MEQTLKYGDKHPSKDSYFIGYRTTNGKKTIKWCSKKVFEKKNLNNTHLCSIHRNNNPFKYAIINIARRSKDKDMSFNVTEDYLKELWEKQKGLCHWFNVPMDTQSKENSKNPLKFSVDRLDNSKGYIIGNVVLACYAANMGRNTCTIELWEQFLNQLKLSVAGKTSQK